LQADPDHDLNKMKLAEETALNGPPVWLDEKAGVVRIPIDQAMKLTLERGLPTQPANLSSVTSKNAPAASAKGKLPPAPTKK